MINLMLQYTFYSRIGSRHKRKFINNQNRSAALPFFRNIRKRFPPGWKRSNKLSVQCLLNRLRKILKIQTVIFFLRGIKNHLMSSSKFLKNRCFSYSPPSIHDKEFKPTAFIKLFQPFQLRFPPNHFMPPCQERLVFVNL